MEYICCGQDTTLTSFVLSAACHGGAPRGESVKVRKLVGFFRFWILHFWRHYLIRDIFGAILHLEMKKWRKILSVERPLSITGFWFWSSRLELEPRMKEQREQINIDSN
jgi:hypothetical protein